MFFAVIAIGVSSWLSWYSGYPTDNSRIIKSTANLRELSNHFERFREANNDEFPMRISDLFLSDNYSGQFEPFPNPKELVSGYSTYKSERGGDYGTLAYLAPEGNSKVSGGDTWLVFTIEMVDSDKRSHLVLTISGNILLVGETELDKHLRKLNSGIIE
jgi:hypothetical protein